MSILLNIFIGKLFSNRRNKGRVTPNSAGTALRAYSSALWCRRKIQRLLSVPYGVNRTFAHRPYRGQTL